VDKSRWRDPNMPYRYILCAFHTVFDNLLSACFPQHPQTPFIRFTNHVLPPRACDQFHIHQVKIIHLNIFTVCFSTWGGKICTEWKQAVHPSIHPWRYNPFRALASLIRRLHSSLFAALLLHPLIPSSCSASIWTTSAHLVLGLPTGLVVWKFPFRTFFGILSSSILIIWCAHCSLLILMSSTMFGSLYKLYSSLFHLGCQHPPSCVGPYILRNIFLSNVFSIWSDVCVKVQVTLP